MKLFVFILNIAAFIGVLLWYIIEPSWESGSTCGITFAALISQFFLNESVKKTINMKKTVFESNKDNSLNKVTQKKNTVTNGNIAGRDINK